MTTKFCTWLLGFAFAMFFGIALTWEPSAAQAMKKNLQGTVKDIAAELKKGNIANADKLAAQAAKGNQVADLMAMFRPAKQGGLYPDGLEKRLRAIAIGSMPATPAKAFADFEEAGYAVAAIAAITRHKPPPLLGKQAEKHWDESIKELRGAGNELVAAATAQSALAAKVAAGKATNVCASCHSVFKDQ